MVVNVFSVLLVAVVLILYVLALPSMVAAVDTTAGSQLENESTSVKSIYAQLPLLFVIVPLALGGVALIVAFKRI